MFSHDFEMSTTNKLSPPAPSHVRLRQIALVAKDLDKAEYLLTKVLGTEVVFVDPAVALWGLKNILVAIGGDLIEVVSPTKPNTTAGRLLSKRGDGGYMIIMQTGDAAARRAYLESRGLARVIFSHEEDDYLFVQYHPKGIKGGMIPELDSHYPSPANPEPVESRFSPWHACGKDYASYVAGMKRHSNLHFMGAVCRLGPGDKDTEAAARQWQELFGVAKKGNELVFTNMRMGFIKGVQGEAEGLVSMTIGVEGKAKFDGILERASEEGLCGDGWINMVGIKWYFVLLDEGGGKSML